MLKSPRRDAQPLPATCHRSSRPPSNQGPARPRWQDDPGLVQARRDAGDLDLALVADDQQGHRGNGCQFKGKP